ncbi:MAG: hypothetical protein EOQ86_20225 [Mesorhizobium sp.]|uniref:hypothetical protein n=1 Tax=Mesorhizobium sp. TaxID=1871066 RepID=UPI000FE4B1E3|nr:hypothetical protein [Mesorhizobium sp.]RWH76942.1 MAG: hypothetical protein EOQ85_20695 [Mesorhizobium sp.]RWH80252.1 MAG: hypothetical protein EOQ86_20225 [Mesorhizobium sp.]RWH88670.1 MAG: hypothetical protein EOQ87_19855 [Mesorhizobium sp.]RWH95526.1 MAG: hypothetical protein EOQ88_21985 [Mesorhizobium sp.]RWI01211.1 MAG: hypothetical protein EOQ89_16195 [Mesorhizobium sp.]
MPSPSAVWGWRRRSRSPPILAVATTQYELLLGLLPQFEDYYAWCRTEETFPQIWVSSDGALGHLDTLADRLRFTDDAQVKRLGELWTYAGERSPVAGQQALISATTALRAHYATGQQDTEDEHLGALLTWIEPPAGRDILAAVAMAEDQPMGAKTDPRFDTEELQPAVALFNKARQEGDVRAQAFHAGRIQQMLETVIRPIYTATQRAMAILDQPRWKENTALEALGAQEAADFARFMQNRDAGYRLPYNDSAKAAAFKIVARERTVDNVEAAFIRHDRAARERGAESGRVLRGTIVERDKVKLAPYKFETRMVLSTPQDSLHLRAGDEIWNLDDPKLCLRVTEIERRGPFSWVSGIVEKGKKAALQLNIGDVLDLGAQDPDWDASIREFAQMSTRLAAQPWTHSEAMPAAAPSTKPRPNDLLAAVERMV